MPEPLQTFRVEHCGLDRLGQVGVVALLFEADGDVQDADVVLDVDEPIRRTVAMAARTKVERLAPKLGEMVDADRPFESTPGWETVC